VLPPAAHEPADLGGGFIGGAFGLLLASLAIVVLGVLWLFPLPGTDRAMNTPLPLYPEPRLQASPRQEMQRFLAAERQQLTTYGWIDKANGIVRIPIDVAMDKVARSGIPGWPTSATAAAAASAVTTGAKQ
jgi:type III secretory pathway lipoprotein EscJ